MCRPEEKDDLSEDTGGGGNGNEREGGLHGRSVGVL